MNASGLVKCDAFNLYWFRLELAVKVIFAQTLYFVSMTEFGHVRMLQMFALLKPSRA